MGIDKDKIKKSLKRLFETPWAFFVATLIFIVLAQYSLIIYSTVHWKLLPRHYAISSQMKELIKNKYKDILREQDIRDLLDSCADGKGKPYHILIKSFDYLDSQTQGELQTLCSTLFMSEDAKRHGLRLLSLTIIYYLFGMLALLSGVMCFIISLDQKKAGIGIVALIFGLLGGCLGMVIM